MMEKAGASAGVLLGEVVDGVALSECRGMVRASGLRAGQPVGCCGALGEGTIGR